MTSLYISLSLFLSPFFFFFFSFLFFHDLCVLYSGRRDLATARGGTIHSNFRETSSQTPTISITLTHSSLLSPCIHR
ncbi:hypothetical protein F4809DRAFT_623689 [Biscogniauxia mediterranea]|nr:hypothetical protein F4809DRAFT_623689 [Biscogniauxia mediterranea]